MPMLFQTHQRLDVLAADMERLCLHFSSMNSSTLPKAVTQAISTSVQSLRGDINQIVEALSCRVRNLESSRQHSGAGPESITQAQNLDPNSRSHALKQLVELELEDLEDRFEERANQKFQRLEDIVAKFGSIIHRPPELMLSTSLVFYFCNRC